MMKERKNDDPFDFSRMAVRPAQKEKRMEKAAQPVVIVQTSSPQRVSMLKVLVAAILLKKIIGVPATHQ